MLVEKYKRSDQEGKRGIKDYYLKKTQFINNWDLVDTTAYQILGGIFSFVTVDNYFKITCSKTKEKEIYFKN